MLILALLSLSFASENPVQALAELEWRRAPAAELVAVGEARGPEVRRALAVALGRLRSEDALSPLVALQRDPDPSVRAAAAEALGYTPGAAPALRAWLDAEPMATWADPAATHASVRPVLLAALGFHAEADDVPRLTASLVEPGPAAAAAAISLGRLGRAGITEAGAAIPALVGGLARTDPAVAEAMAFAVYRVGLDAASPGEVETVRRSAAALPTPSGRAWAVRAVWPRLDVDGRSRLFRSAAADADALVRVAALDSVGEGDLGPAEVAPWLDDEHPWVRRAATAALGRLGEEAAPVLVSRSESWTAWEAAAAVEALAAAGHPMSPEVGLQPDQAAPVRAAAVAGIEDPAELVRLATSDAQASVRTAAAGALLGMEGLSPEVVRPLLTAGDPAVREAGVALTEGWEHEPAVEALIALGLADPYPDTLASAIEALVTRVTASPDGASPDALREIARRGPLAGLRGASLGRALAAAGGVDATVPEPPAPHLDVALEEVGAIRRATVKTSRGTFRIDLYPEVAPVAVANFATLAEADAFDDIVWHRVVPGFVVQGGCPRGDGWGGPGWSIPDEVSALPYDAGAVGMARAARDTGGSQWFVTLTPQPHLVGDYTLFGHVSRGMHVVKRLQRGDLILDVTVERARR